MKMRLFLRRKESKLFGDGQLFYWKMRKFKLFERMRVAVAAEGLFSCYMETEVLS